MGVDVGRSASFSASASSTLVPWSNGRLQALPRVVSPLWAPVARARSWKVVKVQCSYREDPPQDRAEIKRESESSRKYFSQLMRKQYSIGVLGVTAIVSAVGVFQSLMKTPKVKDVIAESNGSREEENEIVQEEKTKETLVESFEIEDDDDEEEPEEVVPNVAVAAVSEAVVAESVAPVSEIVPDVREDTTDEMAETERESDENGVGVVRTAEEEVEGIKEYAEEPRDDPVTQSDDSFVVREEEEEGVKVQQSFEYDADNSGAVAEIQQEGSDIKEQVFENDIDTTTASFSEPQVEENVPDVLEERPSEMAEVEMEVGSPLVEDSEDKIDAVDALFEKKDDVFEEEEEELITETETSAETVDEMAEENELPDEVAEENELPNDDETEKEESSEYETEPLVGAAVAQGFGTNGSDSGSSGNGSIDVEEWQDASVEVIKEVETEQDDSEKTVPVESSDTAPVEALHVSEPVESYFPAYSATTVFKPEPESSKQDLQDMMDSTVPEAVADSVEEMKEEVLASEVPEAEEDDVQLPVESTTELIEPDDVTEELAVLENALTVDKEEEEEVEFDQTEEDLVEGTEESKEVDVIQINDSLIEQTEDAVLNNVTEFETAEAEMLPDATPIEEAFAQQPLESEEVPFTAVTDNGSAPEASEEVILDSETIEEVIESEESTDALNDATAQDSISDSDQQTSDALKDESLLEASAEDQNGATSETVIEEQAEDADWTQVETPSERVVVSKDQSMYPPSYYRPEDDAAFQAEEEDSLLVSAERYPDSSLVGAGAGNQSIGSETLSKKNKTSVNSRGKFLLVASAVAVGFFLLRWAWSMIMTKSESQIVHTEVAERSITTTRSIYDEYEWVSSDDAEENESNDADISAATPGTEDVVEDEDDSGNIADDEEDSS